MSDIIAPKFGNKCNDKETKDKFKNIVISYKSSVADKKSEGEKNNDDNRGPYSIEKNLQCDIKNVIVKRVKKRRKRDNKNPKSRYIGEVEPENEES